MASDVGSGADTDTGTAAGATLFHDPATADARDVAFLDAYVRYGGTATLQAQTRDAAAFDDFVARVAAIDQAGRRCRHVEPGDAAGLAAAPVLAIGERDPVPFAWRRRGLEARRYSIMAGARRLDLGAASAAELILAPLQAWDALVAGSSAERRLLAEALGRWSDYIGLRSGGGAKLEAALTVIPPGIDCAAHADTETNLAARAALRRRLGIADDDLVVLTTGAFSVHARAHPMALYRALERTATRVRLAGGGRFRLIQAGWFDSEGAEREFREALRRFAPAGEGIFLDGRDADVRAMVWHAADIYAALTDSAAELVDANLSEAMAAGLPVVASDWGGQAEAMRDGTDGLLVPTWLPMAGSGPDLATAPEAALDAGAATLAGAQHLGLVGQSTVVDVGAAARAFESLAADAALRRDMGASAAARAREMFDWPRVIADHRDLWRELAAIREREPEVAPLVPGTPDRPPADDPFTALAPLATRVVDGDALVGLADHLTDDGADPAAALKAATRVRMNDFARSAMLDEDGCRALLDHLRLRGPVTVLALAELSPERLRYRVPRTVAWMAKMGLLTLRPGAAGASGRGSAAVTEGAGNLVDLGVAARGRGADNAAAQYLQSALHQHPDDARAHAEMGALLASHANLDDAVDHFRQAIQRQPEMTRAHRDLGKALFLRGDRGEGIAALQRAVELDPEDGEAHYLLGAALRRAGAANEAVHALEASIARDPKRVDALCHLGMARKSLGRRAEAMQAFRDALTQDPTNAFARAAELSLGMEREGRRRLGRDPNAKRVVLHLHDAHHFPLLRRLFEAFGEAHWPLITGDGRELQEFEPQVILVAGDQAEALKRAAPDSTVVHVPADLADRRRAERAYPGADYVCVSSPFIGNALAKRGVVASERIWVTGYPGLDDVFRQQKAGAEIERPRGLGGGRMVVYAPAAGRHLSSATMLAGDVAAAIRGGREDLAIVILPAPEIAERHPLWLAEWREQAARLPNLLLVDDAQADPMPWLAAASAVVSDASGLAFAGLALDRPLVLLTNPDHARDPLHDPDGIEWRWRDAGEEVHRVADLADAVEAALADPTVGADRRARYRGLLFGDLDDGQATTRVVSAVAGL